MTARFIVGDVFEVLATFPDGSVDLVLTSPPFLALRSYLPADHPDKPKEIGSEATPAEYLDTLLHLTAEWARVLAPHGSIAVELGDTYAGSGGAGGDYDVAGLRDGQPRWTGTKGRQSSDRTNHVGGVGWPLDKSLCGIPTLYAWSLAYGRNLLTGEPSPAGLWRIRTLKPWIRSNPPVGALGDKERPATSYVVVATKARDRYFDLDAVRTPAVHGVEDRQSPSLSRNYDAPGQPERRTRAVGENGRLNSNSAGAPPRDWWHHVDAVLDAALERYSNGTTNARASKGTRRKSTGKQAAEGRGGNWMTLDTQAEGDGDNHGPRGVHLRRALERAGILTTLEALDVSPKGYPGAHYAVWPPELCRLLIDEMCPRRVCITCAEPSRRALSAVTLDSYRSSTRPQTVKAVALADKHGLTDDHIAAIRAFGTSDAGKAPTLNSGAGKNTDEVKALAAEAKAVLGGYFREFVQTTTAERTSTWSDCGHDTWRPGLVLDPFVGSGTTLEVATGMGREATGIDLDPRNADLARDRVGMFLDVEHQHVSDQNLVDDHCPECGELEPECVCVPDHQEVTA